MLGERSRRRVILATAVASSLLAIAACAAPGGVDDEGPVGEETPDITLSGEVVWADFGGATNESRQIAYFDSFIAGTGVDVVSTTVAPAARLQMLEGGDGDYDAVHVGIQDLYRHTENLIPLDPDIPRDDALPGEVQDYGFGTFVVAQTQAYLTETFPGGGPENWEDFWDVETFPGARAWPGVGSMTQSLYEIALLADGVAPDDLYPLDTERAIQKWDELRPHMIFYTEYPQIQQLLASGAVSVAYGPTGQFTGLQGTGVDVTISWDQAILTPNVMVIPARASNVENIQALAAWMSDPERQAVFTERTLYGPARSATFELLSDDVTNNLANAPANTTTISIDAEYRASVDQELVNLFTDWLTQ